MKLHWLFILPLVITLTGCTSTPKDGPGNGTLLSPKQQSRYLSNVKPPQQFGFRTFMTEQGVSFTGAGRLHPNHMAEMHFTGSDFPVIKMRGRHSRMTATALIDPSLPNSWMEFTTAMAFDALFLGYQGEALPYRGEYALGGANAYAAVVTQLRFEQLFIENTPLYVRMAKHSLGSFARNISQPRIDVIIGYDVLRNFEFVQFDLDDKVVRFAASTPYTPQQALLMSTARILPQPDLGLAVDGAIFGESTPIILDFAGDFHFARSDVESEGITKQVSMGDVVYRDVPTLMLQGKNALPRAGKKMLEKYIITLANRAGVVYFERIPE